MVHLASRSLRNNCRNFTTPSTKKFYNGIASGEILLWWVRVAIADLFIRRHRPGDSADEQCKATGPAFDVYSDALSTRSG
jgi:hypothetical protein